VETPPEIAKQPLREFIYLDEVSLRSLLSSQDNGVTDTTSEQNVASDISEIQGKIASDVLIAKSELNPRFQTSNSNTLQTFRKSTVQSWFRELHNKPGLRLLEPLESVEPFVDLEDVKLCRDPSIVVKPSDLKRGVLTEFKVRLATDRVFHMSTLVSEFAGMAEDYPRLLAGGQTVDLNEMVAVGKLLDRLLAGLIPIRGEAVDYVVCEIDGAEYLVHRDAIAGLEIETKPLVLVGVTDQRAYWKDIRRDLFSDGEFTVLCRISRTGLQEKWLPVKLADLIKDVAPDLADQMNSASRMPFTPAQDDKGESANEILLGVALRSYAQDLVGSFGEATAFLKAEKIHSLIKDLKARAGTASGQRSAFSVMRSEICTVLGKQVNDDEDARLRERARILSGLPLFPSLNTEMSSSHRVQSVEPGANSERLLDVEVVAMYW